MNKTISPQAKILLIAVLLCVVAFIAVKYTFKPAQKAEVKPVVQSASQSAVPEFTSAKFEGADIFRGLGPEWTYLRQTELGKSDGNWLAGTIPVREAVVKLVNKDVSMMLVELKVEDQTKLKTALQNSSIKTAKVAEHEGYIVPMNDIAGGTAFALIGSDKVLLIQHGKSSEWPSQVEPEIMSFIASLNF